MLPTPQHEAKRSLLLLQASVVSALVVLRKKELAGSDSYWRETQTAIAIPTTPR